MKSDIEHLKDYTAMMMRVFIISFGIFWATTSLRDCGVAHAYTDQELTDAICKAENSVKYPCGIKSIDTHGDYSYAYKICLQSVRNNIKRWRNTGKRGDFIEFMAWRFCPIGASDDPIGLNKNWVKNVKYFLRKGNK